MRIARNFAPAAVAALLASAVSPGVADAQNGGLSAVRSLRLLEPQAGGFGPQPSDYFGWSLSAGDHDGDGVDDLAVGIAGDNGSLAAPVTNSGSATLFFGDSGDGLETPESRRLAELVGTEIQPGDSVGWAVASCDFDGDDVDDLAVGAGTDAIGAIAAAGSVLIFRGAAGGPAGNYVLLNQNSPGVPGIAEDSDYFGMALACGDFDHDGKDDLAIGAPGEGIGAAEDAGWVGVLRGSAGGLTTAGAVEFTQLGPALPSEPEAFDSLGASLAVGDWNGDGYDDLAVGVLGEDEWRGAVHVLFGGSGGLTTAGAVLLVDDVLGGLGEDGDTFGDALLFADFDGDSFDDLVIGVPREDFAQIGGTIFDTGQIVVVYGALDPGSFLRVEHWAQSGFLGPGENEDSDFFGQALAGGDFDGDGYEDLAIGHPGEEIASGADGAVTVVTGGESGLGASGGRKFVGGRDGLPGPPPEAGPPREFGSSLAAGDFDGDGYDDLAVGSPRDTVNDLFQSGSVTILRGALFADGFESGNTGRWGPSS